MPDCTARLAIRPVWAQLPGMRLRLFMAPHARPLPFPIAALGGAVLLVPALRHAQAQPHAPAPAPAPPTIPARAVDSTATIAPGVQYRHIVDPAGPWRIHLLRVDLTNPALRLQQVRAGDSLRSRERTSSMAARVNTAGARVLAAVNADFFDLTSGENENNQVLAGEWWKGLPVTDSPFDTYDNTHAQLAITQRGQPVIDRFQLDGAVWAHGVRTPVLTVNAFSTGIHEGTALFTPRFGATTPRDSVRITMAAPLVRVGTRGDTLLYRRTGPLLKTGGTPIPTNGAVLTAFGARTRELEPMADGDTVRVLLTTRPRLPDNRPPALLIGGWPQILRDGQNVAPVTAVTEGTISRNAETRHPRTAVARSRDGRTLWIYVVDGRSTASVGMTLIELADRLRALGAWQALNFDGGGSTAMVINGRVVNTPSDPTGERAVGNALLLLHTPP